MTINYIVILKDIFLSNIMQAADVFDKGKIVAKNYKLSIIYDEGIDITEDLVNKTIVNILDSYKDIKEEPIFIGLVNSTLIVHTPFYVNDVRQISDGKQWFMFSDWLKRYNYEHTVTEDMYIKHIL